MKKLLLFIALVALSFTYAQETYSRVKLYATNQQLYEIEEFGIDVHHGKRKDNTFLETDMSASEIAMLKQNGFEVEILIEDVQAFYVARNLEGVQRTGDRDDCAGTGGSSTFDPVDPTNFQLGSMGGFYTYEEFLEELDSMRSKYPTLITERDTIDDYLSHENRPIYWVRISDNPEVDEDEEEVLYTAIHHAREPASLSQTIYYMWYVLENYGTNEEVTYLVDNTEMYFVPMINPDGYKYNHTTNPSGGGMHRKNRNPSVGSTNKGVDLNRNYAYHWDESGTSPNPNNDTYAGSGPFSEPETQAIKWFCENHDFEFAFNCHTYGDWLLFPIGWAYSEFAADHDYYTLFTDHMVQYNSYQNAKSSTLYPAAGDSDDWMYIDYPGKPKIFAMTPEVGGDDAGFWPASGQITELCREVLWQNLKLSHMPHIYVVPRDLEPSKVETITGYFSFDITRLGLEDGSITVSLEPLVNIDAVGSPQVHTLSLEETKEDSISFTLPSGIGFGDEIKYVLNVDNGLWVYRDTIVKSYGAGVPVFEDDCSDLDYWSGDWSFTNETFVSPSRSITESPFTNYSNNQEKECVLTEPVYLAGADYAYVTFYAKWEIENDWDFVQFMASTDGGSSWTPLCGKYTNPGSSNQPEDEPLYDGAQTSWVLEEINLSDYIGETDLRLRFYFESDGGVVDDGYFFDDFTIYTNAVNNLDITDETISFSVYPNPATDNLNIVASQYADNSEVMIQNELGQVVFTKPLVST